MTAALCTVCTRPVAGAGDFVDYVHFLDGVPTGGCELPLCRGCLGRYTKRPLEIVLALRSAYRQRKGN